MKNFKSILVIAALFAIGSISAKQTRRITPMETEITTPGRQASGKNVKPFNDKVIAHYSELAKNNDRFTNDFIMSINKSDLSDGFKKDVFEKAIHYYDLLKASIQENTKILTEWYNSLQV